MAASIGAAPNSPPARSSINSSRDWNGGSPPTRCTHASGVYLAAEIKHQGRIIANDVGDESTNAVTLLDARVGVQQQWGKARWSTFLRGDNLIGKTYAVTVIVNEANRRYFEPAAGRTWLAGVSFHMAW